MSAISSTVNPNDFMDYYKPMKSNKVVKHVSNYNSAKKAAHVETTNKNVDGTKIFVPEQQVVPTFAVETPSVVTVPEPEEEIKVEGVVATDVLNETRIEEPVIDETESVVEDVETPVVKDEDTLANTESDSTFGTSMSVDPEQVSNAKSTRVSLSKKKMKKLKLS